MRRLGVLLVMVGCAADPTAMDTAWSNGWYCDDHPPGIILNSFEDGTHWAVGSGGHDGNLTVEILADDEVIASEVVEDPAETRLYVYSPPGWTTPPGAFVKARVSGTCDGESFVRKEESEKNADPLVGTWWPIQSAETGCDTREPLEDDYTYVFRHVDGDFYGMTTPGSVFLCREHEDVTCDRVDTSVGMFLADDPLATLDGSVCTATFDNYALGSGYFPSELVRRKTRYVYLVSGSHLCGKHPDNPLSGAVVLEETCLISESWTL